MQTTTYFDSSPSDSRSLKAVIGVILALNIAQTVSDSSRLLKLDVYHAGDLIYVSLAASRAEILPLPPSSVSRAQRISGLSSPYSYSITAFGPRKSSPPL
jgi:hypothetical protein